VAPEPPTPLDADLRLREILSDAGLPEPDRVEHHEDEVLFFWDEPRLIVAIDL
jgi:hypothetical protein